MSNPTPILNNINAFDATKGTTISFNIIGGTDIVRSNIVYIYDLSTNDLICTHLYISTESIHELPPNTDSSIVYASGKSSADFVNNKNYYLQIQTFTNTDGTAGGSGMSVAKTFWCLFNPALSVNAIPAAISTTSYNVGATYTTNITDATIPVTNIIQQYKFDLYTATGTLAQTSGNIIGSGEQEGTSTTYNITYNFSGLVVNNSYYVIVTTTSTEGMTVSAQSNTFTVSVDTPTVGGAIVNNNACDGYISVVSNLSDEYGGHVSGEMASFETDSVNNVSSLKVNMEPIQDLHGYDKPWVGGAGVNVFPYLNTREATFSGVTFKSDDKGTLQMTGTATSDNYASFTFSEPFVIPDGTTYKFCMLNTESRQDSVFRFMNESTIVDSWSPNPVNREATYLGMSGKTVTGIRLYCKNGETYNLTMKPMFVPKSTTVTGYIPYSNICPISGRTEVVTWDDPKYGGTVAWNQAVPNGFRKVINNGVTYLREENKPFVVTGKANGTASLNLTQDYNVYAGHKYFFCGGLSANIYLVITNVSIWGSENRFDNGTGRIVTPTTNGVTQLHLQVADGFTCNGEKSVPQLFDLTQMFGSTIADYIYSLETANAGAGVAWFRKLFPKPYYAYNTGETTCVSAVNGDPYNHHTTALGRTVYGGTLDVVSGVLTVDREMATLDGTETWYLSNGGMRAYCSSSIFANAKPNMGNTSLVGLTSNQFVEKTPNNTWDGGVDNIGISLDANKQFCVCKTGQKNMVVADWKAYLTSNPLQVCYPLATPQTYQLTPHQIQTLVGQNNVWSDAGDVEVTFNLPITNLLVKRQDTSDTSGKWLTLYSQPITQASDMDFTFIDFLNQHGKTYRYALVPLLTQQQGDVDVEIEGGYTVSDDVLSVFDGVFIANSNGSQKLKASTEYGDLETNQDVGVLTTIGGKYPFVVSNSNLNYHSGSISALIVPSDFYTSGDLDRLSTVERREAIEQFLTDKTAKILKDWNGNIWLITFVENVEVSFVDDYGMGLGTLSAKWVEIGDVNDQTDLQQTGLI